MNRECDSQNVLGMDEVERPSDEVKFYSGYTIIRAMIEIIGVMINEKKTSTNTMRSN